MKMAAFIGVLALVVLGCVIVAFWFGTTASLALLELDEILEYNSGHAGPPTLRGE